MDDYISKPVDAEQLYAALRRDGVTKAPSAKPRSPGASGPEAQVILDVDELLERVGGDIALAEELLRIFAESWPAKLARIRAALEAADLETVTGAVHELKGAAANLGAKSALAAAIQVEKRAEQGSRAPVGRALDKLQAALERLNLFISSNQWAHKT